MGVPKRAFEIAERRFVNPMTRNVMVSFMGGIRAARTRRHLRLLKDEGGLYVRMAKLGRQKKYLTEMAGAQVIEPDLVTFYEVE